MTPATKIPTGRFRVRLIVAFVAAVAIGAGGVALGAYALVSEDRYDSFHERSRTTARLSLSLADAVRDASSSPEELVELLAQRRSHDAVVVDDSGAAATQPSLTGLVTDQTLEETEDGYREGEVEGAEGHYFVLSPVDENEGRQIFLMFPLERLDAELHRMSKALLQAWLAAVVLAGVLGFVLARKVLRPVSRASLAARALAEGILETRLPVERTDEFGVWALSFNKMADALQDKIEALTAAHERERRFTSDVAHELRTPLTALMTSATFLRSQQHLMDADARWAAESVVSQVARLRDLVEELLEISRMDSGQAAISSYDIDLSWLLQTLHSSRGWQERVDLDVDVRRLTTDPRRLERTLANLIDNALMHGGEPVEVSARDDGERLTITVRDHGAGIAPEALPHVFDRFYKADPARGGGSGLGLAIARENARLLGGDVTIGRSDARGTEMVLVVPLRAIGSSVSGPEESGVPPAQVTERGSRELEMQE